MVTEEEQKYKNKVYIARSTAKRYVREFADQEDLEDLLKLTKERLEEVKKENPIKQDQGKTQIRLKKGLL